jgi:hypothetical protein
LHQLDHFVWREVLNLFGKNEKVNVENNGKFVILFGDFAIRVLAEKNAFLTEALL